MTRGTQSGIAGSAPIGLVPIWLLLTLWPMNVLGVFARCEKWIDYVQAFAAIGLAFMIGQRLGARK